MAQANKTLNRSKMGGGNIGKMRGEVWRGKQSTNTEGDKSMKKAQKEDKHNNSNTTNYG